MSHGEKYINISNVLALPNEHFPFGRVTPMQTLIRGIVIYPQPSGDRILVKWGLGGCGIYPTYLPSDKPGHAFQAICG